MTPGLSFLLRAFRPGNPLAKISLTKGNFEILVYPESYFKIAFYSFRVIYPHRNIIKKYMPKQVFIPRQLPPKKPDRCELCPLIGLIPKEDRERGKREKYYCLGIYEPMTDDDGNPILDERGCQRFGFPRLSTREANNVSASQRKEKGHLLHRPCDNMWAAWMRLQGRKFPMLTETYNTYRLPFEAEQQQKQQPKFAFE